MDDIAELKARIEALETAATKRQTSTDLADAEARAMVAALFARGGEDPTNEPDDAADDLRKVARGIFKTNN